MREGKFKDTEIGKIPEEWDILELGELGEFRNGVNFNSKDFGKGFPLINVKNLFRGRYATIDDLDEIKDATIRNFESYRLQKEDILFARSSVKRSGAGQVAMVCNLPSKNTLFSGFIIRFRNNSYDKLNNEYLNYLLRSDIYREYLTRIATGTTITNLSQDNLSKIPILLPPLEDQRAIASILGSLDDKIALHCSTNSTLEAIGQALFKHWFVDFEFPDGEGKPYRSCGGEMVDTELGEVPRGWRVGKLEDIIENIKKPLKPGEHLKERKYVPIDCLAMRQMGVESFQEYIDAKSSLIAFERDDILLGAMRVYFHRVNLSPFAGITRTTTFVLRPKKKEHISFSLFLLNQESTINYANSHSKGTTMPYAVWEGSLSKMEIIIPKDEILTKFNYLIYSSLEKIRDQIFEQITLSKIRDALLPKLMSGEIRVAVK